jgi:hypothetical protein
MQGIRGSWYKITLKILLRIVDLIILVIYRLTTAFIDKINYLKCVLINFFNLVGE